MGQPAQMIFVITLPQITTVPTSTTPEPLTPSMLT